jgi:hypothetical protein
VSGRCDVCSAVCDVRNEAEETTDDPDVTAFLENRIDGIH